VDGLNFAGFSPASSKFESSAGRLIAIRRFPSRRFFRTSDWRDGWFFRCFWTLWNSLVKRKRETAFIDFRKIKTPADTLFVRFCLPVDVIREFFNSVPSFSGQVIALNTYCVKGIGNFLPSGRHPRFLSLARNPRESDSLKRRYRYYSLAHRPFVIVVRSAHVTTGNHVRGNSYRDFGEEGGNRRYRSYTNG